MEILDPRISNLESDDPDACFVCKCQQTRQAKAKKAIEIALKWPFNLMPATTYSPTHFRVQYNRPGGA